MKTDPIRRTVAMVVLALGISHSSLAQSGFVSGSNMLPNAAFHVYGHWTIEVKNPNGKVTTHVEFENSLTLGGSTTLASVLLGNGASVPGGWFLSLSTSTAVVSQMPPQTAGMLTNVDIFEPGVAGPGALCGAASLSLGCASNLAVSVAGGVLTLSGSVQASSGFTIGLVNSLVYTCPGGTVTGCVATSAPSSSTPVFTQAPLGGAGQPPTVPVLAGQTVAATVQITFQ
jgi:hypothetical protein